MEVFPSSSSRPTVFCPSASTAPSTVTIVMSLPLRVNVTGRCGMMRISLVKISSSSFREVETSQTNGTMKMMAPVSSTRCRYVWRTPSLRAFISFGVGLGVTTRIARTTAETTAIATSRRTDCVAGSPETTQYTAATAAGRSTSRGKGRRV